MSALSSSILPETAVGQAMIVGAEIVAGHDGSAELAVRIQYENGVIAPVVLDQDTGLALMRACGASSLDGLVGHAWRDVFNTLSPEEP